MDSGCAPIADFLPVMYYLPVIQERHSMFRVGVTLVIFCLALSAAKAGDLVLGQIEGAVRENFDSFRGTFATLPPGFNVSKDAKSLMPAGDDDFRGTNAGGVTTGGCYAWSLGNVNHALGCQPTGDKFNPGFFMLVASNATGVALHGLSLDYSIVFRNNEDRASALDFEFSFTGTNFNRVAEVTFCTPAKREEHAAWKTVSRSLEIRFQPRMAPGARLWIRWYGSDAGGSGSRDEYGIDNVRLRPRGSDGTVVSLR